MKRRSRGDIEYVSVCAYVSITHFHCIHCIIIWSDASSLKQHHHHIMQCNITKVHCYNATLCICIDCSNWKAWELYRLSILKSRSKIQFLYDFYYIVYAWMRFANISISFYFLFLLFKKSPHHAYIFFHTCSFLLFLFS